jgi:hypothetical protein
VNDFERQIRAEVFASLRETSRPPTTDELAAKTNSDRAHVVSALHALADEHSLVLVPDSDSVWMAHPFSGIETDFVVTIGERCWYANCAWDGLSILALLGDGTLDTHSPITGEPLKFEVAMGMVSGSGLVHFLVPPKRFWDSIVYT